MKFRNVVLIAAALILACLFSRGERLRGAAAHAATTIPIGDVMVSIGSASVQVHKPDGTIDTAIGNNGVLTDNSGTQFTTGSGFDASGNFYVTDFDRSMVSKYDPTGTLIGPFGSGYSSDESIVFDASGNIYVGNVGGGNILKFDASGNLLATFTVGQGRVDWMDLSADQCTMLYTTEGTNIFRFDVCKNMDLTNFNQASLPGGSAFALRIRPDGGVLVADRSEVVRLDANGNQVQTYSFANEAGLFAFNLDPDGTSFWTADFGTSDVIKADISSGNTLLTFNTGTSSDTVFGLSVKGEITVAGKPTAVVNVSPPATTVTGAAGQTVDLGSFTLTNNSNVTETFTTVTINLSKASLFSSLTLTGTFGESTTDASTNSPASSNVLTLSTPVQLGPGQTANFSAQGKIASATARLFDFGSGVALAATLDGASCASAATSGSRGASILLIGMLMLVPLGLRRYPKTSVAAFAFLMICLTGCDPCPSCSHGKKGGGGGNSSTVIVQAIAGTDAGSNAVNVTGLPANLNTVNRG